MTIATTAGSVLRVADPQRSLAFWRAIPGATVEARDAPAGTAVVAWRGWRVLLAGPGCADPEAQAGRAPQPPGTTLYLDGGAPDELAALAERLRPLGAVLRERPWGEWQLTLRDPDGYLLQWWALVPQTPEETLARYAAGPDALEAALAGLIDADLDRVPPAGGWTIRQIVHHLVDAECTVLMRPKYGLAEPGRAFHGNAFDQEVWAVALDYAGRDIGPSVALYRAIRGHVTQLMRHLPGAWERDTVAPDGSRRTAGAALAMLVAHAGEHVEQILALRPS